MSRWIRGICLGAVLLAMPVMAEQKLVAGDYQIHYSALSSTDLQPAIARQYGIQRSRQRAVLMLSPQHRESARAVHASASGTVSNLLGQRHELQFRPVLEGEAYYLLAEFPISHLEVLNFKVEVQMPTQEPPVRLQFSQQFFVD